MKAESIRLIPRKLTANLRAFECSLLTRETFAMSFYVCTLYVTQANLQHTKSTRTNVLGLKLINVD